MSPPNPPRPPHGGRPLQDPHAAPRRERRAFHRGLVVSLVVHLVALALYPALMDRLTPPEAPSPREEEEPDPPAFEVVILREIPEEESPETPVVEDPEEVVEEEVVEEAVVDEDVAETEEVEEEQEVEAEVAEEDEPRLTVADLLRPRPRDPRLWLSLEGEHTQLTEHERAMLLLHGMIRSWNDSAAVAAALARDAVDWTYTDEEGRRWGLSPGRLHLGDFSIPLPFAFEVPPGLRDDARRRQWLEEDAARGAAAAQIRETWAERAREIRRRMDAEREQRRADDNGDGDGDG